MEDTWTTMHMLVPGCMSELAEGMAEQHTSKEMGEEWVARLKLGEEHQPHSTAGCHNLHHTKDLPTCMSVTMVILPFQDLLTPSPRV